MEIHAIDDLYKRSSEKYSLARKDFCTLQDFYETFQINDQETVINLLNLTYAEEYRVRSKELWKVIHKLDDTENYNSEFQKDLIEFRAPGFLLSIYPHLYFRKSEKPDFILILMIWPRTRQLAHRVRDDWTLFSFLLYGGVIVAILLAFDKYHFDNPS